MRNTAIVIATLLLFSSCYFEEQRAEKEIRELQAKLDSIECRVNDVRDFIELKKNEILYSTIEDSDECSDDFKDEVSDAINEMLEEVGHHLYSIEDETHYNDYDFGY